MHDRVWLKRVLIPFWVFELGFLLTIAVFSGLAIAAYSYYEEEDSAYPSSYQAAYAAATIGDAVLLAMAVISIIFTVVTIILFAKHKLNPVTYLVFQCIKMLFWTYLFVASLIALTDSRSFASSIIFSVPIFACALGQLIYASVIMHRKRKGLIGRGEYTGVKPSSQAWGGYESPPRGSYAAYNPHGALPNPFRDPSRANSPNPSTRQEPISYDTAPPVATHPAHREGEAEGHFSAPGTAIQSFEMQSSSYRAS